MAFPSPLKRQRQPQHPTSSSSGSNAATTNMTSTTSTNINNNNMNTSAAAAAATAMNTAHSRSLHTNRPRSRTSSREIFVQDLSGGGLSSSQQQQQQQLLGGGVGGGTLTNTDALLFFNMVQPPQSPNGRMLQQQLPNTNTNTNSSNNNNRERLPSIEYVQSYSGQHSSMNDTLPLESSRSQQIVAKNMSFLVFLLTYLTFIIFLQLISASIIVMATIVFSRHEAKMSNHWMNPIYVMFSSSWTITNALHCMITLISLHWLKGNFLFDEQGEMNGSTIWEQLAMTAESTTYMRRTFCVMPLLLTYIACIISKYHHTICAINITFLSISMLPKASFMFGVRVFNINRTPGFDDESCSNNGILQFIYRFLVEQGYNSNSNNMNTSFNTPVTNDATTNTVPNNNSTNPLIIPVLDGQRPSSTLPYARRD